MAHTTNTQQEQQRAKRRKSKSKEPNLITAANARAKKVNVNQTMKIEYACTIRQLDREINYAVYRDLRKASMRVFERHRWFESVRDKVADKLSTNGFKYDIRFDRSANQYVIDVEW